MSHDVIQGLIGAGVMGALFWIYQLVEALRFHRRASWLSEVAPDLPANLDRWPTVALIYAARDEAAMVERATRSLLALDYPDLRVIAVDDRSSDGTGAILDAIAREPASVRQRLQVIHIDRLPPGWLGKTHALDIGAASPDAQEAAWILLTDADVVFEPETLRRAIALAETEGVDHLAVYPEALTESTGERVFLAMFLLMFNAYAPPRKAADPRSKAAVGIGAFNLVRAEALRAVGGFRRIALSVDEDVRLGQVLKFAGFRGQVALGKDCVSVRWQEGIWGLIRGLEKNFFAGAQYRLSVVSIATAGLLSVGFGPCVGLFVGPWWTRLICLLGIAAVATILERGTRPGGPAVVSCPALTVGGVDVPGGPLALYRTGPAPAGHPLARQPLSPRRAPRPRPRTRRLDARALAFHPLSRTANALRSIEVTSKNKGKLRRTRFPQLFLTRETPRSPRCRRRGHRPEGRGSRPS